MASSDHSKTDPATKKADMHKMARDGEEDGLMAALKHKRDIDEKDDRGLTPLQYAVLNNRPEVVRMLLKEPTEEDGKAADLMIRDENGLSLAHYAVQSVRGKTRYAHSVCVDGSTESRTVDTDTVTSFSSRDQEHYCLDMLIKKDGKGELIYIKDKINGQTPLHYAVMSGSVQSVKTLIKADENKKLLIRTPDSNGMLPLHLAATYKQTDIANELLKNGAENKPQDKTNSTALHYACLNGNTAMVRMLLEHAEKNNSQAHDELTMLLEMQDNGQNTCLHVAAENGHTEIVQILLDNDSTVNKARRDGMLPIHVAVIGGKVGIVEAILNKSPKRAALLRSGTTHSTPLHLAAQYNRVEIAKLLLDKRSSIVNDKDKDSNTPLHIAAQYGSPDIVRLLMTSGADTGVKNAMGRIPLHGAARNNRLEALKELMRPENSGSGKKLLSIPSDDREKIKKELQELRQKSTSPDEESNVRPALETVRKYLEKHGVIVEDREPSQRIYKIVRSLEKDWKRQRSTEGKPAEPVFDRERSNGRRNRDMEKEAQPRMVQREKTVVAKDKVDVLVRQVYTSNAINAEDNWGNTPLHLAAENGHIYIVKCLLNDYRAEHDRKNDRESTALHLAAENGHQSTVEVIVKMYPNAVFAEDQECNTPIHLAAKNGHKEIMDILIMKGADVNQINSNKMTALDLAAKEGKVDICDHLVHLDAHSWVDKRTTEVSSLHLACANGHLDVVKLLLKSRSDFELKNDDGFNCLDVAVEHEQRHIARYILGMSYWEVAMRNSVPLKKGSKKIVTPMRRLILKMPDVAYEVLDKCSERVSEEQKDITKREKKNGYIYNFEYVDDLMTEDGWNLPKKKKQKKLEKGKKIQWCSYTKKATVIKKNHPLSLMVKHRREELLQHHLVNQLVRTKWLTFGVYNYLITFVIHLLFLILLTRYILQTRPPHTYSADDASNILSDNCGALSRDVFLNYWLPTEKFLLYFLMAFGVIFEVAQMINMRSAYLNNLESYVEWVVYVLSFLFLLESNDCTIRTGYRHEWQWSLGAFAIFFVWIDLVLYLKAFTSLGIYVIMFEMVCLTFLKVFIVFFSLITAFALAFHTLLQNKIPFRDVANSILKTSVMFIGEMEYENLFNDGVDFNTTLSMTTLLYPAATSVLFSIFITVACIVLMNLLVGLAVDDIGGILRKAAFKRTSMHVELVLDVEKVIPDILRRKLYIKRNENQNTTSESKSFVLFRLLKTSKIWWWNQKFNKDETDALLTIPDRQERLEQGLDSLKKEVADLTKLLKPIIQDGSLSARLAAVPEKKQPGGR